MRHHQRAVERGMRKMLAPKLERADAEPADDGFRCLGLAPGRQHAAGQMAGRLRHRGVAALMQRDVVAGLREQQRLPCAGNAGADHGNGGLPPLRTGNARAVIRTLIHPCPFAGMTRIRFKGSPRSLALREQDGACGLSAPRRSSPRNRANVGRWRGVSTHAPRQFAPAALLGNLLCVGVGGDSLAASFERRRPPSSGVGMPADVRAAAAWRPSNSRRHNSGRRGCGRRLRRGRRRRDISRHRSDWYRDRAGLRRRRCSRGRARSRA